MPYHRTVGSITEHQAERIHQDGLAGTGFTTQRGHTGAQFHLYFVDNCQVTDVYVREHGGRPVPSGLFAPA